MDKSRRGFHLLISLIPVLVLLLVLVYAIESNTFTSLVVLVLLIYLLIATPLGIVYRVWGSIETRAANRRAHQYAELNGWHPISQTSWRSRKREGAALSVNQAYEKSTYILNIEHMGETTTVDEFETSLWALEFGDWLWEELRAAGKGLNPDVVHEKRSEWEGSRALELYSKR